MEASWSDHFNQVFTPHGHCYLWQTDLLLLHSISDSLIGLAYYSIPLALWVFVKKRTDLAFNWMFLLFAMFIFACGTTHFLEVWNIWNADFYVSGTVKVLAAGISVITAILLWPLIPQAMALPSPAALQATNEQLTLEIDRRHSIEDELRHAGDQLEHRVAARTRELEDAKISLEREVLERRAMETRFRNLFESSPHGIVLIDHAGTVRLANQLAGAILGYGAAELEGIQADQLFGPAEPAETVKPAETGIRGLMDSKQTHWFGLRKNGGSVPLEVGLSSMGPDQASECIISMVDITERHNAERERECLMEQLRTAAVEADHNRAQMEAVFESIQDGIAVFDMDRNLVMMNSALAQLGGVTDVEETRRSLDYFIETYEFSDLEGRPVPVEKWPLMRVLRGESLTEWELEGRRRDTGQSGYFSYSGTPVYDEHGQQILAVVVRRNVTERKHLEQIRRETERRLQMAVSIAQIGFWEWDVANDEAYFSPQWKNQLGYEDQELANRRDVWVDRLHPDDRDATLAELNAYIEQPTPENRLEYRLRHRDGDYRWMIASAMPTVDTSGRAIYLMGTQLDVTESKLAEQRILEAAQHDPLTGLPNRALIFEYANLLLAGARRHHNQVAFLFIDLDRFKPVNDLHGHDIGDQLLKELAQRLTVCVRDEDLVGRLGGDEFLVVLSQIGEEYSAGSAAQHILEALSRPFQVYDLDILISASIGISLFPKHGDDVDALIHNADLAMYKSKFGSHGAYQLFTPELNNFASVSSSIEAKIKVALRRDELVLHYQPVVDMNTGEVLGVEALIRLVNEEDHSIGPQQFIPVAESAGLIAQIGEWVAEEACRQHQEWISQGLSPVTVAINVSPLQFRQRGFLQRLLGIVRNSGINPGCFQIEVTETTVMDSMEEAIKTLKGIRETGIRIALDDFGTGYSSLSRLSNLPLDKLKVDQSFVKKLEHDRNSRAIVSAVIALGRTLDLEIVGEGIESETAFAYLQQNGCNQAQGFFISKPLLASAFPDWYRRKMLKLS